MSALWKLSLTEYGVAPTAGGARAFARLTRPAEKIESAGHYVGACRRLQHLCSLRTSVELVFRRAAEEHAGIHAFRDSTEIVSRLPESWPALIEGMRLLSTPSEMVARGEAHHHCLAMWVTEVRRGNFWVLSIEADETSTALLDRQRRIVQHYGPFNSSPTAACASLLAQWLLLDELWLPPSVPTSNAQELPF